MSHTSVLKNEAIEALQINPDGIYIDATLGRGGHSLSILEQLENGHLFCFDLDLQAIKESKLVLNDYLDKVTFIHDNFAKMGDYVTTPVDGILMDLGVSSPQFDEASRGFSYRFESRLDMRMNQEQALSAYEVVNDYGEEELVEILFKYGEERFSKRIVKNIFKNRPITTTFELVEIIKSSLPASELRKKGHPAKKTFQALRIEVNKELESLEKALEVASELLKVGGHLVVITFHSLEDRIVKNYFNSLSKPPKTDRRLPILEEIKVNYRSTLINVSESELEDNYRAHSAKMRILSRKG
ncbi:MAG TPA: 16S rRNA (cytosine(1402)-N(4))-methyltransferase RsmH [Erysipelothrix sp.]|nr:16S rRNA (cytosine(1402)-N(4))-methyltransferase RsmH [Erysipelothrix sp.]